MSDEPSFLLGTFVGAMVCFLITAITCSKLGFAFNEPCVGEKAVQIEYTGCFSWSQWVDSIVIIIAAFGYLCLTEWAALSAVRAKSSMALALLAFFSALATWFAWAELALPLEQYQKTGIGATIDVDEWTIDVWLVFFGASIMCATLPLTIALLRMYYNVVSPSLPTANVPATEMSQAESWRSSNTGSVQARQPELEEARAGLGPARTSTPSTVGTEGLIAAASFDNQPDPEKAAGTGGGRSALPAPSPAKDLVMLNAGVAIPFLCFCFFITTIGTPMWNFSLNSYWSSISKYSWGYWPVGAMECSTEQYWLTQNPNWTRAEHPGVPGSCRCFRKEEALIALGDSFIPWEDPCPWMTIKPFTDCIFFYGFCIGVVVIGAVAHNMKSPALRREIDPFSFLPQSINPFPNGLTVLEAIAFFSTVIFFVVWFIYWHWGYGRFQELDTVHDCYEDSTRTVGDRTSVFGGSQLHCDHIHDVRFNATSQKMEQFGPVTAVMTGRGWLHILSRVSGHMSSLAFSLTMIPTAKASMLLKGVGMTYEAVMHWHRGLGYVAYFMVTAHMLLWWFKWLLDGTFKQNLLYINTQEWLWITPSWNHYENYCVLMVQVAWFWFTAAIVITLVRRQMYRLFYISHHLTIVFVFFGIAHAWSFWFFVIPGLGLWWTDRLARLIMASEPSKVTAFRALPGTDLVEIEVLLPTFANRFSPGQFALINMPELSKNDWHPFTVNVSKNKVIFLIKEEQGWTKRLKILASGRPESDPKPLALVVGPYGGIPPDEYASPPVFLAAGGIGVTPVLSVFQEAMRRGVPGVTFLWSVRSSAYLKIPFVKQVLYEASHPSVVENVSVVVHVTQGNDELPPPPSSNIVFNKGRPNVRDVMEKATGSYNPSSGFAFGCGPAVLTDQVTKIAKELGYGRNHVEVFAF